MNSPNQAVSGKVQQLTPAQVKKLRENPQNIVYGYEEFRPLPLDTVKEWCRKIYLFRCKHQRDATGGYSADACEEKLFELNKDNEEFAYFLKYYPSFVVLLTQKESGIAEFNRALRMIEECKEKQEKPQ